MAVVHFRLVSSKKDGQGKVSIAELRHLLGEVQRHLGQLTSLNILVDEYDQSVRNPEEGSMFTWLEVGRDDPEDQDGEGH